MRLNALTRGGDGSPPQGLEGDQKVATQTGGLVLERKVPPCKKPKPEPHSVLLGFISPPVFNDEKGDSISTNVKKKKAV